MAADPVLPPASKPDAELTKGEAMLRIADIQSKNKDIQNKIDATKSKIDKAKAELEGVNNDLEDCEKAIFDLVGASQAEVDAFRQRLGKIEGKSRELQRLNDDMLADKQDAVKALEAELNQCRTEKIVCIPEFYNKVLALAKTCRGLYREKKIKSYTVGVWYQTKDCLWNIAGKETIYGDPMLWPKIWQNNTDVVKNPDIIHPGQVLKLPPKSPKTSDETRAERRYWRNKKEAEMEAANPAGE
ncbi:MAG: hypothetical protein B7C24_10390 [Bacteroidetes bacterium 4572_77]|nr:MAG: hypothetical protein B7C24_10390 [Bacteroidetes bacterium 4572_77]